MLKSWFITNILHKNNIFEQQNLERNDKLLIHFKAQPFFQISKVHKVLLIND